MAVPAIWETYARHQIFTSGSYGIFRPGLRSWVLDERLCCFLKLFFWQASASTSVGNRHFQRGERGRPVDRGASRRDSTSSDKRCLAHWAELGFLGQQLHDHSMLGLHDGPGWRERHSGSSAPGGSKALLAGEGDSSSWHGWRR
jgi:hypothetical protein